MAFSIPPSLCATSPITLPHPAMLRGMAKEVFEHVLNHSPPYISSKTQGEGLNSSSKKLLYNIIHPSQQNNIRQNEFLISPYISLLQNTEGIENHSFG